MPTCSTPLIIWFLLVDFATGEPYMGACADKVSVVSSVAAAAAADVADFRDAVHRKYSAILTGLVSSQLLV